MEQLDKEIRAAAVSETAVLRILPEQSGSEIAARTGVSLHDVEGAALELDILPQRYRRNWAALQVAEQLLLHRSTVALAGLGGLGGYVLELLARCGVGSIRGVDGDIFESSNLNRQLLSGQSTLGQAKAEAAALRVEEINPAVAFSATLATLDQDGFLQWLEGSDLVIDALGGTRVRLALHRAAAELGLTVVSAAVAGATGVVATIAPGDAGLRALWTDEQGAEEDMGCLPHGVAVLAGMQSAEAVNILTGHGAALQGFMGALDLNDFSWERMEIG
ncbi:HesA/MoeB/ThiF family protein [Desulfohalobium retbaense]|uniref:UBA/THIF-type NAD/FAD binding protein n=1 Tax=Desulfohalobium retbaense (strain ATCC 49708 / DSM 5692 / JCM 16813 / HR100) TaxID=485915 RepID=C8X4A3_DESRD|nr:ThiF family adenylyltransferase [Desulfohalobium retbaense]ACV69377.1 UBA/THIF-type NAD/FAD binding protein [Desulfohalobium retbaense DSM 5692]